MVSTFAAKESASRSSPAMAALFKAGCPTAAGLSAGHTKAARCKLHWSKEIVYCSHQHMIQRTGPVGMINRRNRKYSKLLVQICWVVSLVLKTTRMICIPRTLPGESDGS